MPTLVPNNAQPNVDLSKESTAGASSIVGSEFKENMETHWKSVSSQIEALGLTDTNGLKQLLTMRNLTKDLSSDPAVSAEATQTAIKVFEERVALDLGAAGVPNDQYVEKTLAAVDILHKHGLLDDQFAHTLGEQVVTAMDYKATGAAQLIASNMEYRGRINDTLEAIVINNPEGIRATLGPMQKIQALAAEAQTGQEFVMSLAELASEGGVTEQICLSMLEATPYFMAADEVPDGMDELRYFVNSF